MTYATEVALDAPVLDYKFENNLSDSGSLGIAASGASATYGSGGPNGAFLTLPATGNIVAATTNAFMAAKSFSIEFWIKTPNAAHSNIEYVVHRNGTNPVLAGIAGGTNLGKVYFYVGSSGQNGSAYSTVTVNDNQWHHIVCSYFPSGALQIFVDGVDSTQVFLNPVGTLTNTASIYIGSQNTGANKVNGSIDEVALYSTALTAERAAAHYAAGAPATSTTVDVDTPTASTTAYDAVPDVVTAVQVDTPTVSLTANDVTVDSNLTIATLTPSLDKDNAGISSGNPRGTESSMTVGYQFSSGIETMAAVKFDVTGLTTGIVYTGVKVRFYLQSTLGSYTLGLYNASGTWAEGDTSFPTLGSAIATQDITNGQSGWIEFTLPNSKPTGHYILRKTDSGTGSNKYSTIPTREALTNKPEVAITYTAPAVNASYDAATATLGLAASVATVDSIASVTVDVPALSLTAQATDVTAETGTTQTQDTATASVSASDVITETIVTPDAITEVETATASAQASEAEYVQNTEATFEAATATVDAYDVDAISTQGVVIDLDTPRLTVTQLGLIGVGGPDDFGPVVPTEDEDKFYLSTMFLQPYIWYRMDAISGTQQKPRAWFGATDPTALNAANPGLFSGVTIGLNDGPNGRKAVYFDGTDYFTAGENELGGLGGEANSVDSSIEFSIKTTKTNQFVMRMDDTNYNPQNRMKVKDIYLKDGKVNLRVWAPDSRNINVVSFDFVGRTNVADGQWHHVVLTNVAGLDQISDNTLEGLNIYVDGNLDIHRRYNIPVSFPDYIGGRPSLPGLGDAMYAALPNTDWFVGEITEVVSFRYALTQDQIFRQNDTLFGFDPVYVETAGTNVVANDVSARGNTKRVLAINLEARDGTLSGFTAEGNRSNVGFQGLAYAGSDLKHGVMLGEYQFFTASIYTAPEDAPGALGNVWLEEAFDVNRMLDLEKDLNLEDYDILTVFGHPTTGTDWDDLDRNFSDWSLFGGPSARQQLENLMRQVRDFAINGGGLYITDPMTAEAVGIIDDFDFVDLLESPKEVLFDYGNSGGDYDRYAAEKNPWGANSGVGGAISNPRMPAYQLKSGTDYNKEAHFYRDLHGNEWQTVRALVDGLTDIPGRITTDAVWFFPYLDQGDMVAEKSIERPTGLNVGDNFIIMGTRGPGRGDQYAREGIGAGPTMRIWGQVAAPVSAVKAGTVVTTFLPTYLKREGNNDVVAPNPYRDHAVTVIVQPGDMLDGQVVKGRIFMNFSEGFTNLAPVMAHVPVDQVPSDAELAGTPYFETAESREWSYSSWRGAWASSGSNAGGGDSGSTISLGADGNVVVNTKKDNAMSGLIYSNRWEISSEPAPTMHYRGLKWVGDGQDASGNATVGVATAISSASAVDVQVEAQRSAGVSVPTARTRFEAYTDRDTVNPDVEVSVSTADAMVQAVPFTEVIELTTATVSIQAHPDMDGVVATADFVVLRLPTPYAILTLEEN